MGDCLRVGKLSWYVTSHPDKLSLAIPPWVCAMSTSLGWKGNLASHWPCVTDNSGLPAYGLNSLCHRDEHPAYTHCGVQHFFLLSFICRTSSTGLTTKCIEYHSASDKQVPGGPSADVLLLSKSKTTHIRPAQAAVVIRLITDQPQLTGGSAQCQAYAQLNVTT